MLRPAQAPFMATSIIRGDGATPHGHVAHCAGDRLAAARARISFRRRRSRGGIARSNPSRPRSAREAHHPGQNHRVSIPATCGQLAQLFHPASRACRQILDLIQRWQPDLALCDREVLPARRALRRRTGMCGTRSFACAARLPLSGCRPRSFFPGALARLERFTFLQCHAAQPHRVVFHPPLKPGRANELLPPILRPEVREGSSQPLSEHVLLYHQTNATFLPLLEAARELRRPVIAYGFRDTPSVEGNLTFKPFHPRGILEDLASCAYAVVNGGHNLICEALAYHKPVFCFPITGQFEQFLNAAASASLVTEVSPPAARSPRTRSSTSSKRASAISAKTSRLDSATAPTPSSSASHELIRAQTGRIQK